MAQPQLLQIKLSRFDAQPWGFRLQGGVDFATPLVVQKVNGGSLAEKAGLIPGDAVLKINDVDVFNLRHKDAQDVVVRSGNNFVLTVQRGGSTWRPHVTPTGNIPQPQQNSPYLQTVTKTSLAHKQQESQHIGCGYNNAARPFANGGDGNVKSIVNKQYNTPVGIYSDESIAETLSAQAEVLAGGVLGVNFKKNEKEYQPDKSEVLKFLREEETGASTPEPPAPANFYWTQSHAIGGNERRTPLSHKHQQVIQEEQPQDESIGTNLQENKLAASSAQRPSLAQPAKPSSSEPADPRVIIMPVCPALQGPEYKAEMEAAAAALQHDDGPRPLSASGHPACALCGVGIVGVFVRIKDKNLHVECFKCATCGTSLKNQGYYNYNNKLYCDIHAKLAALQNPPSGTDGYVPVPIKPNTKLSANTISSALNAHGFSEIPVANGGSVAPPTAPTAPSQDGLQRNNIDLPLPPPPSPTSLQQLGMDNGSEITQELNRLPSLSSASNSLPASSPGHMSQIEVMMEGTVDEMSSGYVSTSPLNSHQASSTSSSTCGIKTNNNAVTQIAALPPPPPPLPPCSQVRQQNEYDMNSQNQFDSGVGGEGFGGISHDSSVGHSGDGKHSLSGGDYNKFLKEYSNKLLTLTKQNNNNTLSNTNILNDGLTPNDNANSYNTNNLINSYHSPSKKSTQTPVQAATHSLQTCDSTTIGSTKTRPTQHSAAVALSPTFANQLKFNSCQQVAKPAATLDPPPPATPDSLSTAPASTAISSTIANSTLLNTANNINSSNNNRESEQLEGATQSIHGKSTNFSSGMLANPSAALDTASNDQPFGEYVTLTGSVIRSVVPPGKGVNINYKVNQGYARPFGAAPAVAPKSPVAYPPQRPAVNPYATLPRTNIGQQELCTKPTNANATLPHKVNSKMNRNISHAHQSDTDLQADGNATAMLTESIGLMNVGDKMDNFMTEAGKIISNMLEARLANNRGTMPTSSHGGSTSSLRSNCSSNQSRSPMVIRKRFDLEDFKNVDPTLPVALKPVVTVQQLPEQNAYIESEITCQKPNPEMFSQKELNTTFAAKLPTSHPMGKLLGICDNNKQNYTSTPQTVDVPHHTHATETDNSIKSAQRADITSCQSNDIPSASKPQDVIYREKTGGPLKQSSSQREGEISTHELDRRSYIEPTDLNVSDSAREGPAFSIHVRALGPKSSNGEGLPNAVMPPENEEVVSQLLKDGKRPICCQCNLEITKGPFITALGRIWCPEHFICVNANCRRPLQDIGFVEEKGDLYCEYCFEKYLAPTCSKCGSKIKGDCLNAIGKQFHPECFTCGHCGKLFGNTPFFLEDGNAYCEADWNELFTTKCFACGFPVEAGDRWVEALNHNYHSQCFNCTYCKQNLEGQSFYNKGGRPFCKNHAR
ncbi:PDZ and LIM domain protein Zasp isoform X3 [Bactrocera neohumeralis]|uniref:PDZ and LIM domain protein Zasp isoform X3 n=1 Tax=Bactrocera neohumeralis TaxID=98809 RepID=UPI002165D713|nr:PDZ and LIM domain protein Zasp isoform X3 [Bactrocera neohumeralis]